MVKSFTSANVPSQSGKTFLVTGANTGIGWDTSRVLAERGARVLLACRSGDKANAAMDRIRETAPDADLLWIGLDLASLDSIAAAAEQVRGETSRLDGLINNAGVMVPAKALTLDGFELHFGVNHLGHFALTGRLLPLLKNRPGARVVTVSSLAHRSGRIDHGDINAERRFRGMERYSMSKIANLLFTHELQRRLSGAGAAAIAVACHPGFSSTELGRNLGRLMAIALSPFFLLTSSSAEGALPSLMAATHRDVEGGDCFGPGGMGEIRGSATKVSPAPHSRNENEAGRLWQVSEEMTGVRFAF